MKKLLLLCLIVANAGVVAFATSPNQEVLKRYELATTFPIDEFDDLIKEAWDLYSQKKYDESLAKCVKASPLRPNDFRPYYISGAI